MISHIINEISEAIFPSNIYCEICGALIDRSRPYSLCDACVKKMHWITGRTCGKCGKALPETFRGDLCYDCMEMEHHFVRGWSCLTYGFYERELMMGIKYSGKGYLARKMGDVLFDRMEELINEARRQQIKPFDIVIPVPISKSRLAARGYNQSELMAMQMLNRWKKAQFSFERKEKQRLAGADENSRINDIKASESYVPDMKTGILIRQIDTKMLRSMNPAERRLALKDAFGIKSGTEKSIEGQTILLVDDIYTTGATADACSRILAENGAEAVYLLTLCSGGNRKPEEDD